MREIENDLVTLRQGVGLTIERLRDAGAVIKACSDPEGPEPPIETIYERVVSAMQKLRISPDGQALWAVFGLDGNHKGTAQDRRKEYGKLVKKQADTLSRAENRAIKELALRLLSRYYGAPPLPTDLPIPHGGYYMPALQVVTLIRDRKFVASEQTRTVVSLVDGADHFVYGTYSPTELSDPIGCTLEPPQSFPNGTLHKIVFDTVLNRGDAHTFTFRETVPQAEGDEAPLEDFAGQTFESPTKHFRPVVKFEGDFPKTIWGYHQLSRIVRPGTPEEGIAIPATDSGVVSLVVADLLGGLCSGIAWRWE
ncbi:hypothetical protein ACQPYE_08020 [Actinosynnema sp. CA-299493]